MDPFEIGTHISVSDDNFITLTLNSQSLYAKIDELKLLTNYFISINLKISAICIQESWIDKSDQDGNDLNHALLSINGYNLYVQNRGCGIHSGLAIYLDDKFVNPTIKSFFSPSKLWECQSMTINLPKSKIRILNMYSGFLYNHGDHD